VGVSVVCDPPYNMMMMMRPDDDVAQSVEESSRPRGRPPPDLASGKHKTEPTFGSDILTIVIADIIAEHRLELRRSEDDWKRFQNGGP
jgi:hypothetical protein